MKIGLAAPISTAVGVVLNIGFFLYLNKKLRNKPEQENKKQKVRLSILPESLTFSVTQGNAGCFEEKRIFWIKSGVENHRDGDVSLAVKRPDYHTDLAPVVHMVAVDVGAGFDKFCEVCIFVIILGNDCATEFAIF